MYEAHVFQHKYTDVQIFVYHCENELRAREKFYTIVLDDRDWIYLCKKVANNV